MKELIEEVKKIVESYRFQVERLKKLHDYPFINECDHIYRRLNVQCSYETWKRCEKVLKRFEKTRERPNEFYRSNEFEKRMDMELTKYPGFLTPGIRREIVEYMKRLEWKLERLEDQNSSKD